MRRQVFSEAGALRVGHFWSIKWYTFRWSLWPQRGQGGSLFGRQNRWQVNVHLAPGSDWSLAQPRRVVGCVSAGPLRRATPPA